MAKEMVKLQYLETNLKRGYVPPKYFSVDLLAEIKTLLFSVLLKMGALKESLSIA